MYIETLFRKKLHFFQTHVKIIFYLNINLNIKYKFKYKININILSISKFMIPFYSEVFEKCNFFVIIKNTMTSCYDIDREAIDSAIAE